MFKTTAHSSCSTLSSSSFSLLTLFRHFSATFVENTISCPLPIDRSTNTTHLFKLQYQQFIIIFFFLIHTLIQGRKKALRCHFCSRWNFTAKSQSQLKAIPKVSPTNFPDITYRRYIVNCVWSLTLKHAVNFLLLFSSLRVIRYSRASLANLGNSSHPLAVSCGKEWRAFRAWKRHGSPKAWSSTGRHPACAQLQQPVMLLIRKGSGRVAQAFGMAKVAQGP